MNSARSEKMIVSISILNTASDLCPSVNGYFVRYLRPALSSLLRRNFETLFGYEFWFCCAKRLNKHFEFAERSLESGRPASCWF